MNVKIVIDGISSESMFDELVRELGYLFKNNCDLQRRGFDIQWERDGKTTSPLKSLDISEYLDSESYGFPE